MHVTLRPVQDDDLPLLFAWQADPASTAMAGVPAREAEAFDAHWAKIRADPASLQLMVLADGEPVGFLLRFPRDGQEELGYWIAREHWGRGIASAAVGAFLEGDAHRPLGAVVLASNAASLRVLDKAGFAEVSRDDEVVRLRLD